MPAQTLSRGLVGVDHRGDRGINPAPPGGPPHVGGEQGAGADRLGQNQRIARAQAPLGHDNRQVLVHQAVDGETQGQFLSLPGMAANQRAAGFVEHRHGTRHHLEQGVLDLPFQPRRYSRNGCRCLRLRPHGKHVAQRMVGRYPAENPGIVDEGPEEIDRLDARHARRHPNHGGIVRCVQSYQHLIALNRMHPGQRARQHAGPDFCPATATPHGEGRDGLVLLPGLKRQPFGRPGERPGGHGKLGKPAHETPVDPVLPAPDQITSRVETAA